MTSHADMELVRYEVTGAGFRMLIITAEPRTVRDIVMAVIAGLDAQTEDSTHVRDAPAPTQHNGEPYHRHTIVICVIAVLVIELAVWGLSSFRF